MKERNKEKREDFFPSFVVSVTHTRARKSRANPDATGTPLSLSLERGKKELAQGEFVSLSRLSGDRAHLHRQTPTSPMLFPLSLSFPTLSIPNIFLFPPRRELCVIFPKSQRKTGRVISILFSYGPWSSTRKAPGFFFFLRAPYLQQTGKRHDKSIEIICKKEKKFRVMISSCHRRCERAAAEAIDACNGCVPPVTRQTPFNFSFLLAPTW